MGELDSVINDIILMDNDELMLKEKSTLVDYIQTLCIYITSYQWEWFIYIFICVYE